MPLVLYTANLAPRALAAETRAVLAAPYVHLDVEAGNPGGITWSDLLDADIRALGQFALGTEVFVETNDPDDVLDDKAPEATRIWWRATLIPGLVPGGSA